MPKKGYKQTPEHRQALKILGDTVEESQSLALTQDQKEKVANFVKNFQGAKSAFSLKLECNGTVYTSEGETILDCLYNIPIDWVMVKTKGTITVTDGERVSSKFFPLNMLRPIVAGKFNKIVWAKNLTKLLK